MRVDAQLLTGLWHAHSPPCRSRAWRVVSRELPSDSFAQKNGRYVPVGRRVEGVELIKVEARKPRPRRGGDGVPVAHWRRQVSLLLLTI